MDDTSFKAFDYREIKQWKLRFLKNVMIIGEMRYTCRISMWRPEGEEPFGEIVR
jgi:hypothetical protein